MTTLTDYQQYRADRLVGIVLNYEGLYTEAAEIAAKTAEKIAAGAYKHPGGVLGRNLAPVVARATGYLDNRPTAVATYRAAQNDLSAYFEEVSF